MQLGIKQKIFLIILTGALILVLGMTLFIRWSFDRGFLRYANTIEQNRLQQLAEQTGEIYEALGSWEPLRRDPRLWGRLMRDNSLERWHRGPPPRDMRERDRRRRMFPRRGTFGGRLQLLDADKQRILGRPRIDNPRYEPILSNGQTVGYLALAPQKLLSDEYQLGFAQEQRKGFALIAAGMILLTALLSLPLSRRLVHRVKTVAAGTRELASGNFQVNVPARGQDELGQLCRDFNRLAHTLQKNEKARRAWVADISHELRTPLAVLRGEIEAIQDEVRQPSEQTLEVLHGEVMALTRLVEDLYQLSLSDAGSLGYRRSRIPLLPQLTTTVTAFAPRFTEKGIELTLESSEVSELHLFADSERLQQLFTNLLENSLRYTDSGGRARVRIFAADDNNAIVEFCDSAPGVDEADRQRLFERLFRGEGSRNRATGGGGLGLSICQNIVEAHEGTIEAAPSEFGGLCIRITLPLTQRNEPGESA